VTQTTQGTCTARNFIHDPK